MVMNVCACVMAVCATVGQTAGEPAHVAVVDIPVISERYQKTADLEAKFEGIRQKLRQQRQELRDKIDRLQRSLQEELKPGTEVYHERRKELGMLEAEMQWFVETEGQRVEQGLAGSLREIYGDIQAAVAEVAKEQSIDIVLASDELPDTPAESAAQVRQQIMLQKVLYWSPRVDLTDQVVVRLNHNYQAKRSESGAGAAPPRAPHDGAAGEPDGRPAGAPKPRP